MHESFSRGPLCSLGSPANIDPLQEGVALLILTLYKRAWPANIDPLQEGVANSEHVCAFYRPLIVRETDAFTCHFILTLMDMQISLNSARTFSFQSLSLIVYKPTRVNTPPLPSFSLTLT